MDAQRPPQRAVQLLKREITTVLMDTPALTDHHWVTHIPSLVTEYFSLEETRVQFYYHREERSSGLLAPNYLLKPLPIESKVSAGDLGLLYPLKHLVLVGEDVSFRLLLNTLTCCKSLLLQWQLEPC